MTDRPGRIHQVRGFSRQMGRAGQEPDELVGRLPAGLQGLGARALEMADDSRGSARPAAGTTAAGANATS
jgi:hypothetical protein